MPEPRNASGTNPLASDPTRPWFILRDSHGNIQEVTQDCAYANTLPSNDVVEAEWPRADWCGRRRPHPPHTWGGPGWSNFTCKGIPDARAKAVAGSGADSDVR